MSQALDTTLQALKAAADPVRLRLLALCHRAESSVSDLVGILGLSQPRISRHLKLLSDAGLVERFRDGHWVYYRTPASGPRAARVRRLLALLPEAVPEISRDAELAAARQPAPAPAAPEISPVERALHRAVLDTVLTAPVGALLDIGAGSARMLKLLGRRATRAVGVDIDSEQRLQARAELAAAGLGNCSIRAGDMHRLEFPDDDFDTVILDEVLGASSAPGRAVAEAARVLRPAGRLLVIERLDGRRSAAAAEEIAGLALSAGLGIGRPRAVPAGDPVWLVSVAGGDQDRDAAERAA